MKKSTFLIGAVSSFLLLIGVFMKIQHWPYAGIVFTIAAALFAFGYATLLLIDKNAVAKNNFQKIINVLTFMSMMIIMIAFLFKIMHWPGAGIGIFIGHFCLLGMIPMLFIHASKESDPVKKLNLNNDAILLTAFSFYIWLVRVVA
jgi:hypothetical protein